MGKLKDWADEQSPFLHVEIGESVEAKFLGCKIVPDNRTPGKEKIQYKLEVDGEEKFFESTAGVVARVFDKVAQNGRVRIEKYQEGENNRYRVEALDDDKVNNETLVTETSNDSEEIPF